MSIHVAGHQMEVGESLITFIQTELRNLLEKYVGEVYESHVHISKDHHEFVTDLSVHVSKNLVIHCKAKDPDAYRSATAAFEKLEKQIKKYRARLRNRKRNHVDIDLQASYFVVHQEAEDTGEDTPLTIAEMAHDIHRLSVSEAVMKLDLTDSPVLMFRNVNNNELNVVYKRRDGNVGWIDPSKRL